MIRHVGPRVGVPPLAIVRADHHALQPDDLPPHDLNGRCIGQVARTVRDGASGPEAFALLLRRLIGHFGRVDFGVG